MRKKGERRRKRRDKERKGRQENKDKTYKNRVRKRKIMVWQYNTDCGLLSLTCIGWLPIQTGKRYLVVTTLIWFSILYKLYSFTFLTIQKTTVQNNGQAGTTQVSYKTRQTLSTILLYISSPFLSAAIQFSSSLFHLPLPDTDEASTRTATKLEKLRQV